MQLIFRKYADKDPVLHFVRADGSEAWISLKAPMVWHDLAHYAVERTLGWHDAFLGLVASGYDPAAFELPAGKRPAALDPRRLPTHALQAEHLVHLLLLEWYGGAPLDLPQLLRDALVRAGLPELPLDEATLTRLRAHCRQLWERWRHLPEGEAMVLEFAEPAPSDAPC